MWWVMAVSAQLMALTVGLQERSAQLGTFAGGTQERGAQPSPAPVPGQMAFLRRMDHIIVATAVDLAVTGLGRRRSTDTVDASLLVSYAGDSMVHVARKQWTGSGPLVLFWEIMPDAKLARVIVGLETQRARAPAPSDHRLAISPPPTLAMFSGPAVSDPVLLSVRRESDLPRPDPGVALERMSTAAAVEQRGLIGVYWETYGIAPTDSLDIAVWIERFTAQSPLRRIGISLRIVPDLNTPVVQSWSEASAATSGNVLDAPVPIVARTVLLDTSRLPRGSYRLEVAVKRPNESAVRGARVFVVR
jgi:hypothetical protein